jgi:L-arabinonolactonase
VTRYDPDGRIERVIELPAAQITCPVFGGPDLEVLYVSSAAIGMSRSDLAKAPDAGGLFELEPGVRGLAAHRFAA